MLKVLRDPSGAVELPTLSYPMLRTVGDRHYQQSRAHLMSLQTSLGAAPQVAQAATLPHGSTWGARMGRRPSLDPQS